MSDMLQLVGVGSDAPKAERNESTPPDKLKHIGHLNPCLGMPVALNQVGEKSCVGQ